MVKKVVDVTFSIKLVGISCNYICLRVNRIR